MKVSPHRYRQSRQGATVTSSKWTVPVVILLIIGAGTAFLLLTHVLQTSH